MTEEREAEIRKAWAETGSRFWRWSPVFEGYQHLDVPIVPEAIFTGFDATVMPGSVVHRLTFTGSYATFPNGSGPDRPRYRFITCEGLIVHQERVS